MLSFAEWPLSINAAIFAVAAALVWGAGSRLAGYVSGIAEKTGLGQAFTGMLLLGGITSLAEIATVTTSSLSGNPALALNNLLGSASINVLLLAVADAVLGRDALTKVAAKPATLFQGTLGIMLLAAVAVAVTVGDVALWHVGLGSMVLFALCVASLKLSAHYEHRHVWQVLDEDKEGEEDEPEKDTPLRALVIKTAIAAGVILVAGFFLAQSGDALAQQTGLGSSLAGLVLVGFATSLPELSSIVAALRLKRYQLAVGDIFGTNLFNIALILLADVTYLEGPILNEAGPFEAVAALLALAMTGIFVLGLLERENKTVLRMGYDSLAAILVFAGGLALLYPLAPQ
ncbi:MAG TPA: sodium:calcium antiporter [Mesorhizobium sp.]|jgi:cation:H+ antiporter|nr:sodium:calcium antiporter [Mesorhizobium sp.]